MGLLNLTPPTIGQPNATEDVDTVNAFSTIQTWANGNVDESNLTNAIVQRMGLNSSGNIGRGATNIAASETRAVNTYATLATPDQVAGIVLPTNGLIVVGYQATWSNSTLNGGAAAIFIGANQLKVQANPSPVVQEAFTGNAGVVSPLASFGGGLAIGNAAGYTGDVTTGQALGAPVPANIVPSGVTALGMGPCWIFAAAGTYTVSVQFRAGTGTTTVLNRKLWVWSVGF